MLKINVFCFQRVLSGQLHFKVHCIHAYLILVTFYYCLLLFWNVLSCYSAHKVTLKSWMCPLNRGDHWNDIPGSSPFNDRYGEALPKRGTFFRLQVYLTIIPWARMGSESIAHEAKGQMGYWLRAHEGESNNCFSKIQLAGQKNIFR